MFQTHHTCPDEAGITLRSICDDGSIGASDIFIIVAGTLVLGAIGVAIWFWMKRRFGDD